MWRKRGLIYRPEARSSWDHLYGILPTPARLNDVLRIFFASTGPDRIGYISYVDVDPDDPSRILSASSEPVLSPGPPGMFDDSGVNPSCIVRYNEEWFMYYLGYQRSVMTPYNVFSGLARSSDGSIFRKHGVSPVLDRVAGEDSIRSAPCVLGDNGSWKMWYVSASGWEQMSEGIFKGRLMPRYHIRHTLSKDGVDWSARSVMCEMATTAEEFGFGRPWVVKTDGRYRMWFSVRRTSTSYRLGYAESTDGVQWERMDKKTELDVSSAGWDSGMICYPAVIRINDRALLFYNGNNNGESGFGWAERPWDELI